MTQQPKYFQYLESAKQAEVAEKLRAEGFVVEMDKTLNDVSFDLVAEKGARRLAYEFKAGASSRTNPANLVRLQEAARDAGLEFRIVVVTPPPRVNVKIDRLTEQLTGYMMREASLNELDILSTHTQIEEVGEVEVSDVHIGQNAITVSGTGTVSVALQYGSDSDEIPSSGNAFPFRFSASLDHQGNLKQIKELIVDTSSFYE
jgi:hypothetical protein